METLEEMRNCPACSRQVAAEVPICPHCTHDIREAKGDEQVGIVGMAQKERARIADEHAAGLADFAKASLKQKQLLQGQQDELMPFWKAWLRYKIVRFVFLTVVAIGLVIAGRITLCFLNHPVHVVDGG
jgi:RNA polymerase subunit RPABC4/transcription elongation factor Spt4